MGFRDQVGRLPPHHRETRRYREAMVAQWHRCHHKIRGAQGVKIARRITARRRVAHQSLVASALLRVARSLLGRSGSVGRKPKFLPPSPPPRGFPELREAQRLKRSATLDEKQ